jgi:mannitol/fructose-specific phosphotransferase system IIA component (Ntr-type)
LKEAVEFGNPDNDPVDLVISLGAVGDSEHIELISELAEFLNSNDRLEKLRAASQIGDILTLIEEYDKRN